MWFTGLFRATNVLVHYRGFALPEGEKFRAYITRLCNHPAFKKTCSTEELYFESYERQVTCYRLSTSAEHYIDMPTTGQTQAKWQMPSTLAELCRKGRLKSNKKCTLRM